MIEKGITIFGTWWCGDCNRTRRFFDANSIPYKWVDIDQDEQAEAFVISTNHGYRSVPTIVLDNGLVLVEPSDIDLNQLLETIR